jgi:hypothetical protein
VFVHQYQCNGFDGQSRNEAHEYGESAQDKVGVNDPPTEKVGGIWGENLAPVGKRERTTI